MKSQFLVISQAAPAGLIAKFRQYYQSLKQNYINLTLAMKNHFILIIQQQGRSSTTHSCLIAYRIRTLRIIHGYHHHTLTLQILAYHQGPCRRVGHTILAYDLLTLRTILAYHHLLMVRVRTLAFPTTCSTLPPTILIYYLLMVRIMDLILPTSH